MVIVKGSMLRRWDIGREIIISLHETNQVDICKVSGDECYSVEVKEKVEKKVAEIPNILLQDSNNLVVYEVYVDGDERRTIGKTVLSVEDRPKPDDYVYTETEILNYRTLEMRIEELEKNGTGGGSGGGGGGTGENGATFIPTVSADGVISWQNDKGLTNPDPVNIKGPQGYTPKKDVDYFDGISVGVDYVDESTEDGGENIVHFTDGSTLTVRNGSKGSPGGGGGGGTGENGATFIPSVSADGTLFWSNDKGLTNPAPVNIKGPMGEDYKLTDTDKSNIADVVISKLPVWEGGSY